MEQEHLTAGEDFEVTITTMNKEGKIYTHRFDDCHTLAQATRCIHTFKPRKTQTIVGYEIEMIPAMVRFEV